MITNQRLAEIVEDCNAFGDDHALLWPHCIDTLPELDRSVSLLDIPGQNIVELDRFRLTDGTVIGMVYPSRTWAVISR